MPFWRYRFFFLSGPHILLSVQAKRSIKYQLYQQFLTITINKNSSISFIWHWRACLPLNHYLLFLGSKHVPIKEHDAIASSMNKLGNLCHSHVTQTLKQNINSGLISRFVAVS